MPWAWLSGPEYWQYQFLGRPYLDWECCRGKGQQQFFLLTWKKWPITFAFKYEWTHSPYFRYWPYGIPGKSSRCSSSAVFFFDTQILFVSFLSCLQWPVILLILSVPGYCPDFLNVHLQIRQGCIKCCLASGSRVCMHRWYQPWFSMLSSIASPSVLLLFTTSALCSST